jgi:hypothetical protein
MEVDLPSLFVSQYEACRKPRLNRPVASEAVFLQSPSRPVEFIAVKSQIEVCVASRLLANKLIYAPPPVHMDVDVCLVETVQHVDYIFAVIVKANA